MAAVAPLLGLLGTVTGMISTFHVITLYGTSDPRLMAGGISEALVTTMLGLAVAIPVMLIHAFLRRRIEHVVGDMEEKALAMSNTICRESDLRKPAAGLRVGAVA
jgi:biopolymer transport protein ExbB